MSVQFAKDEKVIKSFNYANTGYNKKKGQYDTFKSLIVTNKRVIHESVNDKSYNEIIQEYLTVANEDGVVPLDDQLIYVIKTAGSFMGWWNFSDNLDIFGDKIVDPAIAWLFACAVYQ